LGTLTEPHQLTATLNCVTSVARALVRPDASYPAGRSHVLPLLQLVLPGIDPNDFRKALVSTILKSGQRNTCTVVAQKTFGNFSSPLLYLFNSTMHPSIFLFVEKHHGLNFNLGLFFFCWKAFS